MQRLVLSKDGFFRATLAATVPTFPLKMLYDIESDDEGFQTTASLSTFSSQNDSMSSIFESVYFIE
jgi:hypothetical protein